MGHLYSFRQGWQSEALARFLLSHFSFIAQPSTVADDVGGDFYGTLFRKVPVGKNQMLVPNSSYLIQIKSSDATIDLSDKAGFLEQLELPFFVGVADRKALKLQIYSGRALQLIFTLKGVPNRLIAKLVPTILNKDYYSIDDEAAGNFTVNFPRLAEIEAATIEQKAVEIFSTMSDENFLIHHNISSRRLKEFILKFSEDDVRIFSGPGSEQVFRRNFIHRLSEVFHNLKWIAEKTPEKFSKDEFLMYSDIWKRIRETVQGPVQTQIDELRDWISKRMAV